MVDKKTIWLVEDSTSAKVLIMAKLKATGHNVVTFTTTDEAAEKLNNEKPDLLISDNLTSKEKDGQLEPSKITGIELIEISKKAGVKKNILTSGNDLMIEAKGAEADFFLKEGAGWPDKLKTRVIELLGQVQSVQPVPASR